MSLVASKNGIQERTVDEKERQTWQTTLDKHTHMHLSTRCVFNYFSNWKTTKNATFCFAFALDGSGGPADCLAMIVRIGACQIRINSNHWAQEGSKLHLYRLHLYQLPPLKSTYMAMTSLDQRLPALSLVEILACLPVASQPQMRSTSRVFKDIMESERFVQTRRSHPIEVVVVKPKTGKGLAKVASRLVDAFMKSDSESNLPLVESIRVEWEKAEAGDKKSMSFDKPFYKFLQLRVGGEQAPPRPFEHDLCIKGWDPKGAGHLRKAWWASVRSVLDGLPIPPSARVLLLGERRLGGQGVEIGSLAFYPLVDPTVFFETPSDTTNKRFADSLAIKTINSQPI